MPRPGPSTSCGRWCALTSMLLYSLRVAPPEKKKHVFLDISQMWQGAEALSQLTTFINPRGCNSSSFKRRRVQGGRSRHQPWSPAALPGILRRGNLKDLQRGLLDTHRERHYSVELEGGCDKDVEKKETDLALAGDTKIKTVQKLSRNFSCWSKTFQTIWKFSRLFGNFSSYAISSRSDAGLTKVILSLGWCLNKLEECGINFSNGDLWRHFVFLFCETDLLLHSNSQGTGGKEN